MAFAASRYVASNLPRSFWTRDKFVIKSTKGSVDNEEGIIGLQRGPLAYVNTLFNAATVPGCVKRNVAHERR